MGLLLLLRSSTRQLMHSPEEEKVFGRPPQSTCCFLLLSLTVRSNRSSSLSPSCDRGGCLLSSIRHSLERRPPSPGELGIERKRRILHSSVIKTCVYRISTHTSHYAQNAPCCTDEWNSCPIQPMGGGDPHPQMPSCCRQCSDVRA